MAGCLPTQKSFVSSFQAVLMIVNLGIVKIDKFLEDLPTPKKNSFITTRFTLHC